MVKIDHRELLKKYIKHVVDSEGTDCLLFIWPDQAGPDSFTKEEITELRKLGGREDLLAKEKT